MKNKNQLLLSVILMFFGVKLLAQFDIPKKPLENKQTSVYDYIGLLSSNEKSILENKLIKYSDSTSTQIVVATIASTNGDEIGYLATQWAHEWGIGQAKKDNGVFVLLAKNDRKITIRTGYGTEHLLTDYMCRQIIESKITPYFKKGEYYSGLNSGVDTVFKVLTGEFKKGEKEPEFDYSFIIIIIFFIVFMIIASKGNKNNNGGGNYRKSGSRGILETIILSNSGRGSFNGGGSFGGSSSGGFGGGFGGGGFGGGGASGGW